ncbi:hypothetical protein L210DRAFT_3559580 [Boletus edulis BED1]|uniref:Uncharacterized protein n=1 Tax=Boletus edulis BED1 TaxID=1328754 RepID=A0AAD4BJ02_BOLED|nr:hypothetical protein L210DRAFT_3559580 [Boletus edulis BED1]
MIMLPVPRPHTVSPPTRRCNGRMRSPPTRLHLNTGIPRNWTNPPFSRTHWPFSPPTTLVIRLNTMWLRVCRIAPPTTLKDTCQAPFGG